jgi:hypothetical protein
VRVIGFRYQGFALVGVDGSLREEKLLAGVGFRS